MENALKRTAPHSSLRTALICVAVLTAISLSLASRANWSNKTLQLFFTRDIFDDIAGATFLALAFSLATLLYRSRRGLALGWVSAMFALFLIAETMNHALDSSQLSGDNYLSRFGTSHLWMVHSLQIVGSCAGLVTLACLPLAVRRIDSTLREAASSRESQSHLNAAIESSMSAILMYEAVRDENGTIVDLRVLSVNRNAELMLGSTREKMLGKKMSIIFPELLTPARLRVYAEVIETGKSLNKDIEHRVLKSGGRPLILNIQAIKLEDGVAITATDITDREKNRKELQTALVNQRAIIACSPFCMIATDHNGIITSANPAAERMLAYSAAELIGQNVSILHEPNEMTQRARELADQYGTDSLQGHQVLHAIPEKGAPEEREWTYVRRDASKLPVNLTVTSLKDPAGTSVGFLGIAYDLTERKRADEYIQHIAHHDPLTGLPTRTLLRDRLEVAIERARRSHDHLAVIMVDLDNFKRVNDSLGHQAGDKLLAEVSKRLKDSIRKSDTVARMGGDEFIVLLPDLRDANDAQVLALKLLDEISKPIHLGSHQLTVTASCGISIFPECEQIDDLFKNADLAMYRIKGRGRNGVEVYTPGIGIESLKKLKMESALRTALKDNAFEIVYQPQISLANNHLIGVEALLRWKSAEFGFVPPTTFIPIAEETGLIVSIGEWVLRNACKEIAALQAEIGKELSVAINISPRQFQQKNFPETVERALRISGLSPHQVELEITEQLLMVDSEESLEIMERVRKLGVHFAIDDFGTGFSNMAYITRFAVDRIKIDRSFISKCDANTNGRVVTSAIIALAHNLDIEVVAEGVETTSHVDTLLQMKCDIAQGYLYSKPLSLKALKIFAARLPGIPSTLEGKSAVRRAFTDVGENLLQIV